MIIMFQFVSTPIIYHQKILRGQFNHDMFIDAIVFLSSTFLVNSFPLSWIFNLADNLLNLIPFFSRSGKAFMYIFSWVYTFNCIINIFKKSNQEIHFVNKQSTCYISHHGNDPRILNQIRVALSCWNSERIFKCCCIFHENCK